MRNISGVIFLIFTLSACTNEYREHALSRSYTFHTSSGTTHSVDHEMSILPDVGVLEELVKEIDSAEKRVWVETYIWTEKSLRDATIRARARGVDVRVLLEGNVYNTPRINDETIEVFKSGGILPKYTSDRYTFTHMKLSIIDDTWCVSTGNWTYTSFTKNRELILCSREPSIMKDLEILFLADERHMRPIFPIGIDPRIGLSPENMREYIAKHIQRAKKEIYVYNQSVTDAETIEILRDARKRGVTVHICIADKGEMSDVIQVFSGLVLHTAKKPYLHAKALVIDDRDALIGSVNLTQNAIDRNREVIIFLSGAIDTVNQIKGLYNTDCKVQG